MVVQLSGCRGSRTYTCVLVFAQISLLQHLACSLFGFFQARGNARSLALGVGVGSCALALALLPSAPGIRIREFLSGWCACSYARICECSLSMNTHEFSHWWLRSCAARRRVPPTNISCSPPRSNSRSALILVSVSLCLSLCLRHVSGLSLTLPPSRQSCLRLRVSVCERACACISAYVSCGSRVRRRLCPIPAHSCPSGPYSPQVPWPTPLTHL